MAYFYHYTTPERWEKIQKEGLQPGRAIIAGEVPDVKRYPAFAYKPAIFLLPSPAPESWLTLKLPAYGCSLLSFLLHGIAIRKDREHRVEHKANLVLLKVNLLPSDDVRVGDFDIMKDGVMTDYCRSVKKLRNKFKAVASMKVPEIICFNAIPASRIEFVEQTLVTDYAGINSYLEKRKIRSYPLRQ